jgi:hypothetical protein
LIIRTAEKAGGQRGVIPADAESVAVRRLGAKFGMQAVVDQRIDRRGTGGAATPGGFAVLGRGLW